MNKIKFLTVTSFYDEYLKDFYSRQPAALNMSYKHHLEQLMADCFGWANFWSKNLEKTEKFEATEIVVNAKTLQLQWAKEHGIKTKDKGWETQVLEAQIEEFKPDVLFAHDASIITPNVRTAIKQKFPFVKLIIGWDGVALNNPALYNGCDVVMSCVQSVADFYERAGFKGYFFQFGFENSLLDRLIKRNPLYDVSFVGSIGPSAHSIRLSLLANVSRKLPLNVWAASFPPYGFFSKSQLKRLLFERLSEYLDVHKIGKYNKGALFGLDMYQALADSKIVLNSHIDIASKTGNMRMFEATGVGTCLVTDWKDNIKDFFVPDREIVTYKSAGECVEKIKYLLAHESERKQIAAAGQKSGSPLPGRNAFLVKNSRPGMA